MNSNHSYLAYEETGVEWLGQIPSSWSVRALRYLATIETGSKDTVDADPDGDFPFIVRSPTPLRIGTYTYDTEAILTAGDGDVGEIFHHLTGKFDAHQRVYVLRNFHDVVPRFLYYYFSSEFINVVAYGGNQTTVSSLRRPMFTSFPVLVPDMATQLAIAAFLDRETAEIDAFIADQEELIGLLAERRAAAISHAFSNLPGAVRLSIRRIVLALGQGWSPVCDNEPADVDQWGVLKVGCVNGGIFSASENKALPAELEPRTENAVQKGDVLVSRGNTRELVGSAALVEFDHPRLLISDLLYRVRLNASRVSAKYFVHALRSAVVRGQIESSAKGASASMQKISQGDLLNIQIELPTLSIQHDVEERLSTEIAELDAAITDAKEAISLSRERRAALISAAVTGKIDVRGVGVVA